MSKTLSISCLIVLCCSAHAQTVRTPSSMRYTGIGTYSRHFSDAFSVINNQASLCNLQTAQAGFYTERRFMMKELGFMSATVAMPLHNSGVGLSVNRFGFTDYSEMQAGLAYGRKLGSKVDLGIQFNYNTVKMGEYEGASAINVEIGSIWHFTPKLHGGIHLYNASGSKYGKNATQKIPSVYKLGFGYESDKHFFLSAEIAKEESEPVNVNVGVHYDFQRQFFMRFGIATGANNSFAGVGFKWKMCRMDISVSHHPQLGFTPALSILFSRKKKTTEEE